MKKDREPTAMMITATTKINDINKSRIIINNVRASSGESYLKSKIPNYEGTGNQSTKPTCKLLNHI